MKERVVCPLLFLFCFAHHHQLYYLNINPFLHPPPRHRPLPFCICPPLFIFIICIFVGDCFSVLKIVINWLFL
ncbi:unnamed protein product [Meloidogyne enterolobii]|uniref:Uncharacterized protein n=1 Tax=Meloidogyne enterolobii TaxID=390850 RepID=A0ACB1AT37_MELEN